MAQKESPQRRELKKRIARERQRRIVEAGGRRLYLLLQPAATHALAALMERDGETATDVISRLLINENRC